MMDLSIYTVDSFTNAPFCGNPAAVCILPHSCPALDDITMQQIAAELNLSETAFVYEPQQNSLSTGKRFNLRWFTPTNEVNLCGHATLASAAVLFRQYNNCNDVLEFDTLSGILTAKNSGCLITLDLPLADLTDEAPSVSHVIVQSISNELGGLKPLLRYSSSTKKLLVRLPDDWSRNDLESLPIPDKHLLLSVHDGSLIRGVILTTSQAGVDPSDRPYHFISRYFAPWNGIPEDPVTGSAHTVLGRYWSEELSNTQLYCRQCSKRGGDLNLSVDIDSTRIHISGNACIVVSGALRLPSNIH